MNDHRLTVRRGLLRGVLGAAAACVLPPALALAVSDESATGAGRLAAGRPSVTAMGAALQRALHQVIDSPPVFDDPLALGIVGEAGRARLQALADNRSNGLRAYVAMRSRYAEDRLAAAVARGVRQYVLLGAGLDTYAWRNPHAAAGLRVFEVDHPATQAWKRTLVAEARLGVAPASQLVPVDFAMQRLDDRLTAAGFRFDQPAFFSMLGVVIYLPAAAALATMAIVAQCAPGSEIVFSYAPTERMLNASQRDARRRSMLRVAAIGEPWIGFHEPEALETALHARGFASVEHLAPDDAGRAYFAGRADGLRMSGTARMIAAVV